MVTCLLNLMHGNIHYATIRDDNSILVSIIFLVKLNPVHYCTDNHTCGFNYLLWQQCLSTCTSCRNNVTVFPLYFNSVCMIMMVNRKCMKTVLKCPTARQFHNQKFPSVEYYFQLAARVKLSSQPSVLIIHSQELQQATWSAVFYNVCRTA